MRRVRWQPGVPARTPAHREWRYGQAFGQGRDGSIRVVGDDDRTRSLRPHRLYVEAAGAWTPWDLEAAS